MNTKEMMKIFGECYIDGEKIVIKEKLHETIDYAKSLSYSLLKSITAVDLADGFVELIYTLYSFENEENLIISIKTNSEAASITDIFPSAAADENEIYDMFGIYFLNNDDLKRLYMPENWEGHPLRKDYVQDDTRIAWNDDDGNS